MKKLYYFFLIFLLSILTQVGYAESSQDSLYVRAFESHEQIIEENRLIGSLSQEQDQLLPLGMGRQIGNQNYMLAMEEIDADPLQTTLSSSAWIPVPQTGDNLAFFSEGIKILPHGLEAPLARMMLISDHSVRLSNSVMMHIKGSEGKTFVVFNDEGFVGLNLAGEFEFCSGLIEPDDPTAEYVKARFETSLQSWDNFVAKVSIDPFRISKLKGVSFYVEDATVDYSDIQNPAGISFPREYHNYYPGGVGELALWKGFYLRKLTIKLPENLSQGTRKEIRAENMIIDHRGVSGVFSANKIIPYSKGSLGGWAYSLDQLAVRVECNSIKAATLSGVISIPVLSPTDTLGYQAIIDAEGKYIFTVHPPIKGLSFSLLQAKVNLYLNSIVQIGYVDGKFIPRAVLHVTASIATRVGEHVTALSGIEFQNLIISSEKPYISVGDWGIKNLGVQGDGKLMNFTVMLENIKLYKESEGKTRLNLGVMVAISNDFAAASNLDIYGAMKEEQRGDKLVKRWAYDRTQLNKLYVNVQNRFLGLEGYLEILRKDPIYGDGFAGGLKATLSKFEVSIQAQAQFGEVNGLKYWYVDGLGLWKHGIPTGLPGLDFYGFGGGAYSNMRQERSGAVNFNANAESSTKAGSNMISGASPSGIRYIPDASGTMGFKASTIVGTSGDSRMMNGKVELEMSFHKGGGLSMISLRGDARMMSKLETEETKTVPAVHGLLDMYYDFDNQLLHGTAQVFMNVAGGVIRGTGPGYAAGQMVFHFDHHDWYIHVGRPSQRLGVVMGIPIGGQTIGIKTDAYLMAGTQIDPMPDPPPAVMGLLGGKYHSTSRNESAIFQGKGLAFGASLSVNTGKLQMLIFYAQLQAGIGADLMLANYGDATCAGSSDRIGINGWYASGQAYAYLEGAIGIRITVFKWVHIDEEILHIGAAALLQAKLPNPFWMKGTVGGEYSLLSGKIKGRCDFEVVIGEECKIENKAGAASALVDMGLITQLTPAKGESGVDICATPQLVLAMPQNKTFTLSDNNNESSSYRLIVDEIKLVQEGKEIAATISWNEKGDVGMLSPIEVLEGEKQFSLKAKVHVEQLSSNGVWSKLRAEGKVVEELAETNFTTGKAPDHIEPRMVKYSYPMDRQLNFYTQEYNQGYIKLTHNFAYLFKAPEGYKQIARLTAIDNQEKIEFTYAYQSDKNEVVYNLPGTIRKGVIYRIDLVNVPLNQAGNVDANVKTQIVTTEKEGANMDVESKEAQGVRVEVEEKMIYTAYFRTSEHGTLSEKINRQFNFSEGWSWAVFAGVHQIGTNYKGEPFDQAELDGINGVDPLIQVEALESSAWFTEDVYPLVYAGYPLYGAAKIAWRDVNKLGLVPLKTVSLKESLVEDYIKLTEEDISNGKVMNASTLGAILYRMPYHVYYDYRDIQQQVANLRMDSERIRTILSTVFPSARRRATYPVRIQYVLPTGKVTSSQTVYIKNP